MQQPHTQNHQTEQQQSTQDTIQSGQLTQHHHKPQQRQSPRHTMRFPRHISQTRPPHPTSQKSTGRNQTNHPLHLLPKYSKRRNTPRHYQNPTNHVPSRLRKRPRRQDQTSSTRHTLRHQTYHSNIAILKQFTPLSAQHLLPFNFAVGVHRGCDMVIHTIRNGVEKYITQPQQKQCLPSRSLVSLDIKNMFNSISREKLIFLIRKRYPNLAPFAEALYAEPGYSIVKMSDGLMGLTRLSQSQKVSHKAAPFPQFLQQSSYMKS